MSYFSTETFDFLRELSAHNEREWFLANKERYEKHVRTPAMYFIRAVAPDLSKISKEVVADPRPNGGSLFRIHRDLRFARDKTPYNPEIGMYVGHREARSGAAPGFFLRISPGQNKSGGGVHTANAAELNRIRDAIVAGSNSWRRSVRNASARYQHELRPGSLKRLPRGYAGDHPCAEDLKRTSFFLTVTYTDDEVIAADFIERFIYNWRSEAPFMAFLARALGLPWQSTVSICTTDVRHWS